MAGCGCKKNNQVKNQTSNDVSITEKQTTNDVENVNLIDQEQINKLLKKITEINKS
jgi:hypothetical protein